MKQKKSKQSMRVLVLEPDQQLATAIVESLQQATPDALIEMAHSLEEAQQLVLSVKPELFVLDMDATHDLGQDFVYDLRTSHSNARAIVLTGVHLPEQREQVSGLGAIHFLEKPLVQWDFVDLVERLLRPGDAAAEKFQGTLRDLQFTDIIQLKCMSGASSVVEFTGPNGEKARVYFESGQVRHATAPGRQGMEAFNEIVRWKGGTVSEVSDAPAIATTIDMDWQRLLMEAVRGVDEMSAAPPKKARKKKGNSKILAVDDSLMLLSFVKEVLIEANYDVVTASTGEEAVRAAQSSLPDLILLDFILPDMRGDEVCRRLLENPGTTGIPVVYMSGYGAELQASRSENSNVIGFLNKPFTSDLLIKTVETHMPRKSDEQELEPTKHEPAEPEPAPIADLLVQNGLVLLATSQDPELYCPEAPVALSNVDADRVAAARAQQQETGCPPFLTLAQENLISHEPATQLAQHHGQKLFAELWAAPCIRFSFHQGALPEYANGLAGEMDVDQWALATLRFVQFPQLGDRAYYDPASIPAYTRDGFERIQNLRLTVAEAQFASQFNGARSVQQIAKNLRLDLKFASVMLFRFLALEIVECWSPTPAGGQEKKGIFQKIGNAIGPGEKFGS